MHFLTLYVYHCIVTFFRGWTALLGSTFLYQTHSKYLENQPSPSFCCCGDVLQVFPLSGYLSSIVVDVPDTHFHTIFSLNFPTSLPCTAHLSSRHCQYPEHQSNTSNLSVFYFCYLPGVSLSFLVKLLLKSFKKNLREQFLAYNIHHYDTMYLYSY